MQSKQNHSSDPLSKSLERLRMLLWQQHIEEKIQEGIAAAMQSKEDK